MRWVDLQRNDPALLELELASAGTTPAYLVRDALDDPALREKMKLLSPEARVLLALEYYGDEGHPQPEKRTPLIVVAFGEGASASAGRTPDWGRLPPRPLESGEPTADQQPTPKKPRYAPPHRIEKDKVKQLMMELVKRKADRGDRDFTQARIAERLGLKVTRVQQAEGLQRVGWDLLRTHPDFPVDAGFVRWPGVDAAARILKSGRTEK
jgi:hypothetical protein